MIKVFIDFADVVSLALKNDKQLCYFTTFDYSETVLDNIYSILSDVKVTSATVVLHGKLGGNDGSTLSLPGAGIFESVTDVNAVDHLLKAAGIPAVEFFEFAGYYFSQGKQNVLFVDQEASIINLIVYKEQVITTQLCTEALLEQTVSTLYNRYELTEVIDVKNLIVPAFLNYFTNISSITDKSVLPVLSLFAFTLTTLADNYSIDVSKMVSASSPNPEVTEKLEPVAEDITAEKPGNKRKEAGNRKKERNQPETDVPKKKGGLIKFLSFILVLILAALLAITVAGDKIISRIVEQRQQSLSDLSTLYQSNQYTVEAYQRMEQASDENASCMSGVELAGKLDFSKSSDNYINVTNTGLNYVGYFKTRENAQSFLDNVKKAANVTSSRIAKSKKGTYQCKLTATVA